MQGFPTNMKVVYLDGETSVALYVKASSSKPDSSFVTQVNSQLLEFDDPEELLAQLPPEARLKLVSQALEGED